jgi:hypothetical protein
MSSSRGVGANSVDPHPAGPPRFLGRSVPARRPQPPPESPMGARARYFPTGVRLPHLWQSGRSQQRNEAESGSLALRLACSPREASPAGLLRPTLAWLPVERAILRISSSHLIRSTRLILAHQRRRGRRETAENSSALRKSCPKNNISETSTQRKDKKEADAGLLPAFPLCLCVLRVEQTTHGVVE